MFTHITTASGSGSTASPSVSVSGVQAGDVILVALTLGAARDITPPDGFESLDNPNGATFAVFAKTVAAGGESSIAAPLDSSTSWRMAASVFRPATGEAIGIDYFTNTGTPPEGLTPALAAGDSVVWGMACQHTTTITNPSGFDSRYNSTSSPRLSVCSLFTNGPGTSGPHNFSASTEVRQAFVTFGTVKSATAPIYAGSAVNDSSIGTTAWTNPGNATTSNNSYASHYANPEATQTQGLQATGFGFALPTDAVIDGIQVEWEVKNGLTSYDVTDYAVRIVKGGAAGATDLSSVEVWSGTEGLRSYGGATEMWGETWTAADINSADFGAEISADCVKFGYPYVDSCRITVFYSGTTPIEGSCAAEASASGELTTGIYLEGTCEAEASASGDLTTGIYLEGTAAAQASASLTYTNELAGTLAAVASASGALTTQIRLAGSAAGAATASAELTVPGSPTHRRATHIFLAEVQAWNPATSSVVTLRFSTGEGYNNGGTFYEPRIEQPCLFRREIGGTTVGGRAQMSMGETTLLNPDGGLSSLADYYFDGRSFVLKWGDKDAAYATFQTVVQATIESVSFERQRVSVRLKDRATTLDKPFSETKFAGTDDAILPLGLEGRSDSGLKNTAKPRVFGRIALMTPTFVNSSHLIYQVSDKACAAIVNVYDGGAVLGRYATDYPDINSLQAAGNAPPAGYYRVFSSSAGTYFRLGSANWGAVSCSVVEDWDYLDISAAGIIKRVLVEKGLTASDYVQADFDTLNGKVAAPLGVIVGQDETTASLIDRICQTVGAYWSFDALSRFRVARLEVPSGTPVAEFDEDRITAIDRRPEAEMPAWSVLVASAMNYAVQDSKGFAGCVPTDRKQWLESASRDQKASDAATKTSRLLAEEKKVETSLFASESQALAEAQRRLSVFGARRDLVTMTVAVDDPAATVDIGAVISVSHSKYGYADKLFTVIGAGLDYQRRMQDLILFG